jgi:tRNA A-37 threonylcarbamoyl transferase component Bud32/ribosomal protein L40E
VSAPLGYREASLVGVGATSRVYRAVQGAGGRVVALKRLHRQLVQSPEALARLRRELEALGQLEHPSIVRSYDVVKWEGDPTIVMDFVPGVDLAQRVEHGGPLPAAEVERVARALLSALAAVHARGIVHRDVKPQNVRLHEDGRVVLLDFGSARLDAASQLTRTGSTVGTPEYMPPELYVGPAYDPRSDVYGVGATLFEALTGRPPHTADTPAELACKRNELPAPPVRSLRPDTPEALAQLVDRSLAIQPEDRFPTAGRALWALDHAREERLLAARRSAHPLCVHCGSPNAPEATACSRCGSLRPFRFDAGPCHVVVDTVTSSDALLSWLCDLMPERAHGAALRSLAVQVAALSFERQRLASFVSEADARSLVAQLAAVGATAHVEQEPAARGKLLGLLGLGVFITMFAPLAGPALALGGGVLLALARWLPTRRDLTRRTALPKPAGDSGSRALVGAGALGIAAALGAAPLVDVLSFRGAYALAALSLLAWAAAELVLGARGGPASPGPELLGPERRAALRWSLFRAKPRGPAQLATTRMSGGLAAVVLLAATSLVPIELLHLSDVYTWVAQREGSAALAAQVAPRATDDARAHAAEVEAARQRVMEAQELGETIGAPRDTAAPIPAPVPAATSAAGVSPPTAGAPTLTLRAVIRLALGLVLPLLVLLAIARSARRAARIRVDAARLQAAAAPPRRSAPYRTRRGRARAQASPLAPAGDAFLVGARRRAADLTPLLSAESAERMDQLVLPLARPVQAGDLRPPDGLLAQCVLETDQAYALRFQLLELEGELEAEAALAWADRSLGSRPHD